MQNQLKFRYFRERKQKHHSKHKYRYREIVGSLLYVSTKTRSDIAYIVNYVSRHVEELSQERINERKELMC